MTEQHLGNESGGRHSLPLSLDAYQRTKETDPRIESKKYQSIVGGLLFIARMTRPEISVHVPLLGRRTKDATERHLQTDSPPGVMVFALNEERRNYLVQSRQPGPNNIYRRSVRGREITVADWSYDVLRQPTDWMVQQATGCGISLCNGSGIYCGLRRSEGCGLGTTIPIGAGNNHQTLDGDGQRGGIPPKQDTQVHAEDQAYRIPLPLPTPASPIGEAEYPHHPWGGQPSGTPHNTAAYDNGHRIEGQMDGYLATIPEEGWALGLGGV